MRVGVYGRNEHLFWLGFVVVRGLLARLLVWAGWEWGLQCAVLVLAREGSPGTLFVGRLVGIRGSRELDLQVVVLLYTEMLQLPIIHGTDSHWGL